MVFKILKLRNNVLIKFLLENLLIFLCTYQIIAYSDHSEKELLIFQRRINIGTIAKPTCCLDLKIKNAMVPNYYFCPFKSGAHKRG
jgi:hypothetical protein